jgi:hypothetical protein
MNKTLEEQIETLNNLAETIIDCLATLAKAHPNPEVKMDIASKIGAFAITEKRDAN